jgi:hypothetical protein
MRAILCRVVASILRVSVFAFFDGIGRASAVLKDGQELTSSVCGGLLFD